VLALAEDYFYLFYFIFLSWGGGRKGTLPLSPLCQLPSRKICPSSPGAECEGWDQVQQAAVTGQDQDRRSHQGDGETEGGQRGSWGRVSQHLPQCVGMWLWCSHSDGIELVMIKDGWW